MYGYYEHYQDVYFTDPDLVATPDRGHEDRQRAQEPMWVPPIFDWLAVVTVILCVIVIAVTVFG